MPGRDFFPDGGGDNQIRLNFSNTTVEAIREGIPRLGEAPPRGGLTSVWHFVQTHLRAKQTLIRLRSQACLWEGHLAVGGGHSRRRGRSPGLLAVQLPGDRLVARSDAGGGSLSDARARFQGAARRQAGGRPRRARAGRLGDPSARRLGARRDPGQPLRGDAPGRRGVAAGLASDGRRDLARARRSAARSGGARPTPTRRACRPSRSARATRWRFRSVGDSSSRRRKRGPSASSATRARRGPEMTKPSPPREADWASRRSEVARGRRAAPSWPRGWEVATVARGLVPRGVASDRGGQAPALQPAVWLPL